MSQLQSKYSLESLFGLQGKVVFITGASGQIGGEITQACFENGAKVVAVDLCKDALLEKSELNSWPLDKVSLIECDIRSREEVVSAFEQAEAAFGVVDCLVNNAGVSVFEPFHERSEESFDWVMDVNLKGTFWCTQQFIERNKSNGVGGAIVNIASLYGMVSPDPRIYTDCARKNSEVYGATKAGVIQMTKYFAVHAAEDKIRVNAIAPGGMVNPQQPQGEDFQKNYSQRCPMHRMGELNELPGAIVFLLSQAASYVNGQTIAVDGGFTAW